MDEPNSTILLQQNPSFGETLYQVHFSCRRRVLKTTTPQPFYGPFSGTTQVSRCQKRTSGLYGAREDLTEADTPIIRRHSIWTNLCPPPPSPIFYRPDALPAAQPTVSKHWRQETYVEKWQNIIYISTWLTVSVRTFLNVPCKSFNHTPEVTTVIGWLFVKRFTLCYRTVILSCLSVLSVCDVGVL